MKNIDNVELFLDALHENIWRDNIHDEAVRKFDSILDELIQNKSKIIKEIITSINSIESIKNEQNDEFSYTVFKKWLDKYCREHIIESVEK